jgi:hypothetical protein
LKALPLRRSNGSRRARGRLVADILAGAWRADAPTFEGPPEDFREAAELLLLCGAGAAGWRMVRNSTLSATPAAGGLQQAYRLHTIQTALQERSVEEVFGFLRAEGIEPVLVKGWVAARLYPERGLRPYGDIDVCVRSAEYEKARTLLLDPEAPRCAVDLHKGFANLSDYDEAGLFERAVLHDLGETAVRIPCPEDHLRILSLHLLRHGAWRPLWLCDIAAALESRERDFDWGRCLGSDKRSSDWVACAMGLSHRLLGAEVAGTPVADRAANLPAWLVSATLKQWGTPHRHRIAMASFVRRPMDALKQVSAHWPNPIEGTVGLGGAFNGMPRLPFQLGHTIVRTLRLLTGPPRRV